MFRFLGVVSKASLGLASVPLEQHKSGNLWEKTPQIRVGYQRKKTEKVWSFANPPLDPPLVFFTKKKLSS